MNDITHHQMTVTVLFDPEQVDVDDVLAHLHALDGVAVVVRNLSERDTDFVEAINDNYDTEPCLNCGRPVMRLGGAAQALRHVTKNHGLIGGCRAASFMEDGNDGWDESLDRKLKARVPRDTV